MGGIGMTKYRGKLNEQLEIEIEAESLRAAAEKLRLARAYATRLPQEAELTEVSATIEN
jgi:hypothetical protein